MKSTIFKTFFLSLCIVANIHLAHAQTASLLPNAVQNFVDNNGKPLTAGTVEFDIPNTTTKKTIWQDAAKAVAWTNPITLNSAGRPPSDKGIYGDGIYRQIVKDKLGNIIWDQVTSSAGGSSGSSTASTGDGDLVGTIKPWAGLTAPNQYVFAYGQEISRATYSVLFTAITSTQAVFCSNGSPVLSGLSDTSNFPIGGKVEVSCVVSGASTIISKTSSSITLAANSNVSTNTTAIIFPWGNGNASNTFNVPDFRGFVIAGNNIMGGVASSTLSTTYFGTNPNSIGAAGGSQSTTLHDFNIPPLHSVNNSQLITVTGPIGHTAWADATLSSNNAPGGANGYPIGGHADSALTFNANNAIGVDSAGTISTPFSQIQPTKTSNYIIKITPDTLSAITVGVTSLGGMTGNIACGTGISCTGNIISSTIIIPTLPYISPVTFGAACDGVTDDAVALQAWLTNISLTARTGYIPPGPNCITRTTLVGDNHTTIIGGGMDVSAIKGLGSANPVFSFTNKSYVHFSDFSIIGGDTQTSWAVTSIGAILFKQTVAAAGPGEYFHLRNMKMYGFNTNYWVSVDLSNSVYDLTKIDVDNIEVISSSLDMPTDPTPGNNGNLWLHLLSGPAGGGQIAGVSVNNIKIYGRYLCSGSVFYGNVNTYSLTNNKYSNLGQSSSATHCINGFGTQSLAYGMIVYDFWSDGHPPKYGIIDNNSIINAYSAGIYMAGDGNPAHTADSYNDFKTLISNNIISGQADSVDPSIPRAAIAITNATNISVFTNRLTGNFGCVAFTAQITGTVDIEGNRCSSDIDNASGFRIQGGPGTGSNVAQFNIISNDVFLTGTGTKAVRSFADIGYYYGQINILKNRIFTTVKGVDLAGVYASYSITMNDNTFAGTSSVSMADLSAINTGITAEIKNNSFNLTSSTLGIGLLVTGSTANIINTNFSNRTSGAAYAFSGIGTQGTLIGTQFSNVLAANQVAPTSIGLSIPTWSAQSQDRVQNLSVSVSGNLINNGWVNTSAGVNWQANNGIATTTWTTYIPTISAQTPGGTPPTFTLVDARYIQNGKTTTVKVDVAVTAAGTGTGFISFTLPFTGSTRFVGSSYEYGVVGTNGIVFMGTSATTASLRSSGAAYIVTGQAVVGEITYEAQ